MLVKRGTNTHWINSWITVVKKVAAIYTGVNGLNKLIKTKYTNAHTRNYSRTIGWLKLKYNFVFITPSFPYTNYVDMANTTTLQRINSQNETISYQYVTFYAWHLLTVHAPVKQSYISITTQPHNHECSRFRGNASRTCRDACRNR